MAYELVEDRFEAIEEATFNALLVELNALQALTPTPATMSLAEGTRNFNSRHETLGPVDISIARRPIDQTHNELLARISLLPKEDSTGEGNENLYYLYDRPSGLELEHFLPQFSIDDLIHKAFNGTISREEARDNIREQEEKALAAEREMGLAAVSNNEALQLVNSLDRARRYQQSHIPQWVRRLFGG
jgi:hypothetical protein